MSPIWKKNPVVGVGIGVGLLGAVALALRHRSRQAERGRIPDEISPAIFATRVANTSHGDIVYHVCGSGVPLVFLHGMFLGASSYEWSKVYTRFAVGHEVLAPDLIGYGESERPAEPLDADDHVESLSEFLRAACSASSAIIVASGLTCQVALRLAARHPELVARLVLFLPSTLRESVQAQTMGLVSGSLIPGIGRLVYQRHTSRTPFIRSWLLRSGYANPENLAEETIDVLASSAQQYGAEHAILGLQKNRKRFDATPRLADIHCPTHVLWPANAPGFPLTEATTLCRHLSKPSLEVLNDCSAFAPMESPELLVRSLKHWLDGDLAENLPA
ncbi:MAG: alpha/beta fold hydrolase [Terrimicrobiaceae bacterium]